MIRIRNRWRRRAGRQAARGRPRPNQGRVLILTLLLIGPLSAPAETVYVHDRLLLGVHETKTLNSPIIKLLPSGTALEVLERDEPLVRVRAEDGLEGWVDASYLGSEEPPSVAGDKLRRLIADGTREMERARQIIGELEREVTNLTGRAEQAEAELEVLRGSTPTEGAAALDPALGRETRGEIERLAEENASLKLSLSALEDQLAADSAERAEATAGAETGALSHGTPLAEPSAPLVYLEWLLRLPWTWVTIGVALTFTFAAGAWAMDWRQRRRHGGFRV